MREYEFKVNETARPIFIKAETEEEALDQIKLIGYTIKPEEAMKALWSKENEEQANARFDNRVDTVEDIALELDTEQYSNEVKHIEIGEAYDPLAFLNSISAKPEVELNFDKPIVHNIVTVKKISKLDKTQPCDCCENLQEHELPYFGRTLYLCDTCYAKEKPVSEVKQETTYGNNLQDRIEKVVAKTVDVSQERWQLLYNQEIPAWLPENFTSNEEFRDKLTASIVELENMVFESKVKLRKRYDSARELEAKLSKAERAALINDPNFKVPENSQYKTAKERMSKEDKARKDLMDMGMSKEQIDEYLGKK